MFLFREGDLVFFSRTEVFSPQSTSHLFSYFIYTGHKQILYAKIPLPQLKKIRALLSFGGDVLTLYHFFPLYRKWHA